MAPKDRSGRFTSSTFIVDTSVFCSLPQILHFFWLSLVTPLHSRLISIWSSFNAASAWFKCSIVFTHSLIFPFIFIAPLSPGFIHPSSSPRSLDSLYARNRAFSPTPSAPPLSLTDTTRCSHPPKTTSNSQRHQRPQSVSQAVSQ